MENKQQTSVQWLIEKIENHYYIPDYIKGQAIEIEKEQIIQTYLDSQINKNISPLQYFINTFQIK